MTNNINYFDVFISGGGIAGLLTAYCLGKAGRKVLVVEKNAVFNYNGADVLKPSGIEIFESLGLYQSLYDYGAIKRDRVLVYYGGELISEMDYTVEHERKYFLLIPYKNVLNLLIDRIKEIENIQVFFNTEITTATIEEDSENISQVLLNNNMDVKAKVYVAADGIMSKLRSLVRVSENIHKYSQQMYFSQFPIVKSVQNSNKLYVDKNNALAYFYPVGTSHFRCVVGFSKTEGDTIFLQKDLNLLKKRLSEFVTESDDVLESIDTMQNFITFPLCKMNLEKYYKGNTVFIGNSAHSIHPITGQGMNLAIEDAGDLVPLLESFLSDSISLEQAFNSYQSRRHFINESIINYGDRLINSLEDKEQFSENFNSTLQTSNRQV